MEDHKIVVTGGAGFLGSHVVKLLLEKSNEVLILDDFSNGKMAHLNDIQDNPLLQINVGDITNPKDVAMAFTGRDIVIHLAVLGLRQSIKKPRRVNQVIVDGTMNCLEAALKNNVKLFLNCSSSEVYGTAAYVPMDEKHPLHPETPYAAAKVAQDMYVYSYGQTYDLPWTTIRPFNMYGPNSHWQGVRGELIPKMIVRAMNQTPLVMFGDGEQTRDFLYVEEAAHAIFEVLDNQNTRNRHINFCTGVETPVKRIAEIICERFNLDPKKFIQKQPSRPGDVMRHLGDNTLFKEITGYTPTVSIEEGINRTVDWLKSLPFTPEKLLSQEKLRNWE
jgi:UDP-glucose 4-epimerase